MGEEKKGFWGRLVEGLSKTRDNIVSGIDSIFSGFSSIDDDFYEEIEEILIMGDIGVNATESIIESLKEKVKENHIKDPAECKELLINSIKEQMDVGETAYRFETEKSVVLVIGVNGVGKTTSVGKLAGKLKDQGKKVVLAAADTFRAAAGDQLQEWANRAGVDMIGGQEGADPAAIVYDAVAAAKARNADVLLCDTAGRLHNKKNLMEELKKINRILEKEYPDAYRETLVVLDATTGQNALNQAREFSECADITGIILTKMDGTAVKTPGSKIFPYIQKNLDDIITVEDDELVVAFLDMVENHKMIVENSGLLTVAALKHLDVSDKRVVSILSGGNMDVITMSSVVQQGLIFRDRIFTVSVLLPDKPGELSKVSAAIAAEQGNVIKLEHNQFVTTNRSAAVELRITLESFGTEHKKQIMKALEKKGYKPKLVRTSL